MAGGDDMSDTPEPGQYFVVRTKGFVAWLIRRVTRSEYNHAGIVVTTTGATVEAARQGAHVWHIRKYGNAEILFSHECLSDAQRLTIIDQAYRLTYRHVPYGWADLLWLGLAQYGVKWRRSIDKRDDLTCGQLVAVCYEPAGIRLSSDNQCDLDVTPGDLARRIGRGAGCGWVM
jgi:hypothetical protein